MPSTARRHHEPGRRRTERAAGTRCAVERQVDTQTAIQPIGGRIAGQDVVAAAADGVLDQHGVVDIHSERVGQLGARLGHAQVSRIAIGKRQRQANATPAAGCEVDDRAGRAVDDDRVVPAAVPEGLVVTHRGGVGVHRVAGVVGQVRAVEVLDGVDVDLHRGRGCKVGLQRRPDAGDVVVGHHHVLRRVARQRIVAGLGQHRGRGRPARRAVHAGVVRMLQADGVSGLVQQGEEILRAAGPAFREQEGLVHPGVAGAGKVLRECRHPVGRGAQPRRPRIPEAQHAGVDGRGRNLGELQIRHRRPRRQNLARCSLFGGTKRGKTLQIGCVAALRGLRGVVVACNTRAGIELVERGREREGHRGAGAGAADTPLRPDDEGIGQGIAGGLHQRRRVAGVGGQGCGHQRISSCGRWARDGSLCRCARIRRHGQPGVESGLSCA